MKGMLAATAFSASRLLSTPPPGLERLRTRLFVLGFWILLGAVETAKEAISAAMQGLPRTFTDAVLVNFPWWFFWAFGTLVVVWIARRWPLDGPRVSAAVVVHAMAASALVLLHLALVASVGYYGVLRGTASVNASLGAQFGFWLQAYAVLDFFVYWMVLGAYHALFYHRRFVEGRLREAAVRTHAAALETVAAEARLHALQMELNPHFLFNALNAVSALVDDERNAEATTMLARLGELLRMTLHRGQERETELEDELDYVGRYLALEQVRFGERLNVRIDVPPELMLAAVPPLILQPLIENAVRHGAAHMRGATTIRIEARRADGALVVRVCDDGPGPGPVLCEGTGLGNVRERLQALYGAAAELSLAARAGGGCVAEIRLPYETRRLRLDHDPTGVA
jgi:signal transduction histidine kinase